MPLTLAAPPSGVAVNYLWRRSVVMPTPVLVNGFVNPGAWTPSSRTEAEWGRLAVFLNDVDITWIRGHETIVDKLSWEKPFWWLEAEIRLRGIGPHEAAAAALPSLLADEMYNKVEVWRVTRSGGVESLDSLVWAGFRNAWRKRGSELVMGCKGRFRHADDYVRAPLLGFSDAPVDISTLIATQLDPAFRDLGHNALTEPVGGTGIESAYKGGWEESSLDYCKIHLATAYDLLGTGKRWTVLRGADDDTPELRLDRFGGTVDFSLAYDHGSVSPDLAHEDDMVGGVFYTETTDAAGTRDRGIRETDDVTPVLIHQPVVYDPEVHDRDDEGDGTVSSHPLRLVAGKHRREVYIAGGQGYDRTDMARVCGEQLARDGDAGWVGDTFRLARDPEEMSRLDIRPDMNGRLRFFHGLGCAGLKHHVVGTEWQRTPQGAYDVNLKVDTNARDPRQIDAILKRNKELATNPTRALRGGQQSIINKDDQFPWDPVRSGHAPPARAFDGTSTFALAEGWNVGEMFASDRDWIISLVAECNPDREFSLSLWAGDPRNYGGGSAYLWLPTNPLADGAWDTLNVNLPPQVYLAGVYHQEAGYSPKVKYGPGDVATGAPITGLLLDQGGFGYTHDEVPAAQRDSKRLWWAWWIPAGAGASAGYIRLLRGPSGS